jgi:hypothetical protein
MHNPQTNQQKKGDGEQEGLADVTNSVRELDKKMRNHRLTSKIRRIHSSWQLKFRKGELHQTGILGRKKYWRKQYALNLSEPDETVAILHLYRTFRDPPGAIFPNPAAEKKPIRPARSRHRHGN